MMRNRRTRQNSDDGVLRLGTFRCLAPHCETCEVEVRCLNGREISDPQADVEIVAKLKVRDFTVPSWAEKGKNAKRHNIRALVNLDEATLMWNGKPLELSNLDEILAGIRELFGGAKREQLALRPDRATEIRF